MRKAGQVSGQKNDAPEQGHIQRVPSHMLFVLIVKSFHRTSASGETENLATSPNPCRQLYRITERPEERHLCWRPKNGVWNGNFKKIEDNITHEDGHRHIKQNIEFIVSQ